MNILSIAPNELTQACSNIYLTVHVNEILYSLLVYEINESRATRNSRRKGS